MGSSWGDFVCGAFESQESLVGETKEQKGPSGKGRLSRGGEGFKSLSYCYSVLHTVEEFSLF